MCLLKSMSLTTSNIHSHFKILKIKTRVNKEKEKRK